MIPKPEKHQLASKQLPLRLLFGVSKQTIENHRSLFAALLGSAGLVETVQSLLG